MEDVYNEIAHIDKMLWNKYLRGNEVVGCIQWDRIIQITTQNG